MHDTVKELESIGAVERITNLEQYLEENPNYSFLAHMPVIRAHKESTKCRMVFLSNLADKNESSAISHNQAMHSGPSVNQKLTTSMMMLRFDPKLLCFDLRKAFLQIALGELDQSRLLFLWYANPAKNDFSLVTYKSVRLPFGLGPSPTILMIALFKILVVDAENDPVKLKNLKQLIYSLIYMDNGAITSETSEELLWAYDQLNDIFNPYCFELQQFISNDKVVSQKFETTESDPDAELFGMIWNKDNDTFRSKQKFFVS
jgi:hypothetical protein